MLKLSEGLSEVQQRVEDVEARFAFGSLGGSDAAFGSHRARSPVRQTTVARHRSLGGKHRRAWFWGTCTLHGKSEGRKKGRKKKGREGRMEERKRNKGKQAERKEGKKEGLNADSKSYIRIKKLNYKSKQK